MRRVSRSDLLFAGAFSSLLGWVFCCHAIWRAFDKPGEWPS